MSKMLEDEVIRLRALEPEDLSLLYTIENDAEAWEVSNVAGPYSRYALKRYLAAQPVDIFESRELRLVIVRHSGCESLGGTQEVPVGLLDLTGYEPVHARAEVGIALLSEERGKGYAGRALALIHEYARCLLRLHQLYAHVAAVHNPRCRSLFLRAGYEEVALLPEWNRCGGRYEDVALMRIRL